MCTGLQPELCDSVRAKCKLLMNREAGRRAAEQANKEHDWWKSRQDSEGSFFLQSSSVIPLKTADSTQKPAKPHTSSFRVLGSGVPSSCPSPRGRHRLSHRHHPRLSMAQSQGLGDAGPGDCAHPTHTETPQSPALCSVQGPRSQMLIGLVWPG